MQHLWESKSRIMLVVAFNRKQTWIQFYKSIYFVKICIKVVKCKNTKSKILYFLTLLMFKCFAVVSKWQFISLTFSFCNCWFSSSNILFLSASDTLYVFVDIVFRAEANPTGLQNNRTTGLFLKTATLMQEKLFSLI